MWDAVSFALPVAFLAFGIWLLSQPEPRQKEILSGWWVRIAVGSVMGTAILIQLTRLI